VPKQGIAVDGTTPGVIDLEHLVRDRVGREAHRVLVQACKNVGECSYTTFEPRYQEAVNILIHFLNEYPSHSSLKQIHKLRQELIRKVLFYYQRMYEQPCLICDACRSRISPWVEWSPIDDCGDFEHLFWCTETDLASEYRAPIWSNEAVPEWFVEWIHQTFWDPTLYTIFWKPSRNE
jgi:hypothetical protein